MKSFIFKIFLVFLAYSHMHAYKYSGHFVVVWEPQVSLQNELGVKPIIKAKFCNDVNTFDQKNKGTIFKYKDDKYLYNFHVIQIENDIKFFSILVIDLKKVEVVYRENHSSSNIPRNFRIKKVEKVDASNNQNDFINSIDITFKERPKGTFMMGTKAPKCPQDDPFTTKNEKKLCLNSIESDELPYHEVKIKAFYMGKTEVTQLQYYKVMGKNPSKYKEGKLKYDSRNNPVEMVNWKDVNEFIKKLNAMENTNKYRL